MAICIGVSAGKEASVVARPIADFLSEAGEKVEIRAVERPWEALQEGNIQLFITKGEPFFATRLPVPLMVSRREALREVIVANNAAVQLENFAENWKIGVLSIRQQALIRRYFAHIEAVLLPENTEVDRVLAESDSCDGMMLAHATVNRMGLGGFITQRCNPHAFPPALGQGLVLTFGSLNPLLDTRLKERFHREDEAQAWICEQHFARLVAGTPHALFGVATRIGDQLSFRGGWISEDGSEMLQAEVAGSSLYPEQCAEKLLAALRQN